jgi:two-component system cell cycle sensor histidine kinase/response regulator CckA
MGQQSEMDALKAEIQRLKDRNASLENRLAGQKQTAASIDNEQRFRGATQGSLDRKNVEIEVTENNTLLQTVMDAVPAIISLRDSKGRILFANKFLSNVFGIPPEAFVGKIIAELIDEETAGTSDDLAYEVLATGEPIHNREFKPSGNPDKTYLLNAVPTFGASDETTGTVITALDITDRKQAELTVIEKTAQLQTVLDAIPFNTGLRDINNRYLLVNKALSDDTGIPTEFFVGKTVADMLGEVEDESIDDLAARVLERGKPLLDYEYLPPHQSGKTFLVNAMPTLGHDGNVIGVATVSMDITERKDSEKLLRLQSDSHRLLNAVTSAANAATETKEAMRVCLDEVCAFTGWPVGHVYQRAEDGSDALVPTKIWHLPDSAQFSEFRRVTEATLFHSGIGLPGRVLDSGEPAWIVDVTKDPNFPRAKMSAALGVKAGFAFPVLVGSEVAAVLEFFAAEAVEPSEQILELMAQLGRQLGLVIERKRAEEELRLNEVRFRDFAESASDWFWEMGPDLRFTYISERFFEISGHRPEEKIGTVRTEIAAPNDLGVENNKWATHLEELHAQKPFKNLEYSLTAADGRVILVRTSGVPVFQKDGTFQGYRGTATDITERKQAEIALRESETQLRLVMNNLPVMISYIDRNQRYVTVNETACEWSGLTASEIVGRTVKDVFGDSEHGNFSNFIEFALAGEDSTFEAAVNFRTGVKRDIRANYIPNLNARGEVIGYFSFVQDITEQNRAQAQLRQAQKMETVGQLTGGIAHDFNNMLSVILGNLDLAAGKANGDDILLPLILNAVRGAERGAELISQLLSFARKQPLAPKAIDLNNQITSMLAMLRRTLGETVEIEAIRGERLWACEADPGQVENALLNLAINARDAMPGGGKLTIETANTRVDDENATTPGDIVPGQYVILIVSDTGTGMPPHVLEQVFEPFFTTKEVGKGSGLGLSMVFGFAKQSNGHVAIYSEEGCGTTIKLYLPRTYRAADELQPVAVETPQANGESILLVEDDSDLRILANRQLKALGYKTGSAMDGRSALKLLESDMQIDLLLTDIVLPGGMGGGALAQEAAILRPTIKTLFMSGYTQDEIVHQGKLDDGVVLLEKPFRRWDLARKLREVLDRNNP